MSSFKLKLDTKIENLKKEETNIKLKKRDQEKNHNDEIKEYKAEIE
jgi:hypothetical protein